MIFEYRETRLCPNRLWFQRHESRQTLVAEATLIAQRGVPLYRWRIWDTGRKPIAEGSEATMTQVLTKVLRHPTWTN